MIRTPFDDAQCPTPSATGGDLSGRKGSYPLPDEPDTTDRGELGLPNQTVTLDGISDGFQPEPGNITNNGKNRTLGQK